MLGLALKHRVKTVLLAAVIFLSSLALVPLMGMNFLPPEDKGTINIDAELDSGLSLSAAGKKAEQIEKIVEKYPDVTSVYSTIQRDSLNFYINLTDKKARKQSCDEIAAEMRTEINQIPGLDLCVTGSRSMNQDNGKRYSLHIQGNNFDQLVDYSQKAKQLLASIPGDRRYGQSATKRESRKQESSWIEMQQPIWAWRPPALPAL